MAGVGDGMSVAIPYIRGVLGGMVAKRGGMSRGKNVLHGVKFLKNRIVDSTHAWVWSNPPSGSIGHPGAYGGEYGRRETRNPVR